MTQRQSQLDLLPIPGGAVVLLGDSHLAYGAWDEWLPGLTVVNRGVPGAAIVHVSAFAKTLSLDDAAAVVLQVGTNDLLFEDARQTLLAYRTLVRELRVAAPGARLIVCTLPGVNNEVRWTGLAPEDVAEVNDGLRVLAKAEGLGLVDVADAFDATGGVLPEHLTDDGVHLRGEGYQVWVRRMRPLLTGGTTFAE